MDQRTNVLPPGYPLSDRFQIESVLGYGGFSVTYKAAHRFLPEQFAIKEYFPHDLAFRDRDGVSVLPTLQGQQAISEAGGQSYYNWGLERFLSEAKILYAIEHPHVVRVRDYFPAHGTAYLVMRYEEGEPLDRVLKREGTLPEDRVRRLLNELLDALEAVHAAGYLHRDIKPENIYLRRQDGGAMLIDFGGARQALTERSRAVTALVSPSYSPFEQYLTQGGRYYGPWTDIYALGATLYRCITGRAPIEAPDRQMGEKTGIYLEPAVRLGAGRYGRNLLAAVDRALAMEPQQRFQSVAQMRAALSEEAASEERSTPPPSQSVVETLLPERIVQEAEPESIPAAQPSAESKKRRRKWAIVGILLLLAATAAALMMDRFRKPEKPVPPIATEDRPEAPVIEAPPPKPVESPLKPEPAPQAAAVNKAVIKSLEVFRDRLADGSQGPELVTIPAGEFWIGSPEGEPGRNRDEKRYRLRIERPFAIGRHEVTVGEFRRFVEATGYRTEAELGNGCYGWREGGWRYTAGYSWRSPRFEQDDNHPVVCVSWNDAMAYAQWLTRQSGQRYRLPTEAEWEYAARSGTASAYGWGEQASHDYANYAGREGRDRWEYTAPVGSFPANGFGLYDLLGNVWEWTCSAYDADYGGAQSRCADRAGARRVLRGGPYDGGPTRMRAANRSSNPPEDRNETVGFRLARSLDP